MDITKHHIAIMTLVVLLATSCTAQSADSKPKFTAMDMPTLEGGYQIETGLGKTKRTHFLTYYIKEAYPATRVWTYYTDFFDKNGWTVSQLLDSYKWISYPTDSPNDPFRTHRTTYWDNPELGITVMMALIYRHEKEQPDDELQVLFESYNYFALQAVKKFEAKLIKEKKNAETLELLGRYHDDQTGEVDLERAIRENPDNKYLKEYKTIEDRYYRE